MYFLIIQEPCCWTNYCYSLVSLQFSICLLLFDDSHIEQHSDTNGWYSVMFSRTLTNNVALLEHLPLNKQPSLPLFFLPLHLFPSHTFQYYPLYLIKERSVGDK